MELVYFFIILTSTPHLQWSLIVAQLYLRLELTLGLSNGISRKKGNKKSDLKFMIRKKESH